MKTQAKVMAASAAPAAGLKRINLAGIATKSPASKTAKAYPVLPDPDGQAAALVEGILDKSEQLEALEGALEIEKGELIALAKPFYFAHHAGQMAVASSIEARAGEKVVRVGFSNSYRGSADDAPILRAVGDKGSQFFKQSFELKIKGDMIPEVGRGVDHRRVAGSLCPPRGSGGDLREGRVQAHEGLPHGAPHAVLSRAES